MKISLLPTIDYLNKGEAAGKVVIVIDVLRATSVITTAIENGAKEVIPVIEIEEALKLKTQNALLGGERKALKIDGFDLANSPLDYKKEVVKDKTIIISTTNGTKAINKAVGADKILIGSILNGKNVAKEAVDSMKDIIILCAGTAGKFSLDDFICAGKLIYEIQKLKTFDTDDFSSVAYAAYRDNKNDLISYVSMASHYKYLVSIGLEPDIKYCFTEDRIQSVAEFRNGSIVKIKR